MFWSTDWNIKMIPITPMTYGDTLYILQKSQDYLYIISKLF